MKDEQYEVVLNFIKKASDALVDVMDELEEFGDKTDQRFVTEALDLTRQVNRFYNKVNNHRRVMYLTKQGEALTAP